MPSRGSISAIEPQGPKSRRVAIWVDGVERITVHRKALQWLEVEAGVTVDVDELLQAVAEAEHRAAMDASFALLAVQDRSANELCQRLRQKGFAHEVTRRVVERLRELGYMDDRRYAIEYVRARMAQRPAGRRALYGELRRKGVDSEMIEEVLDECFGSVDEAALAAAAIEQRLPRLAKLDANTARSRLVALLQRRGFDFEVIRDAVSRAMPEIDDEDVASSGE